MHANAHCRSPYSAPSRPAPSSPAKQHGALRNRFHKMTLSVPSLRRATRRRNDAVGEERRICFVFKSVSLSRARSAPFRAIPQRHLNSIQETVQKLIYTVLGGRTLMYKISARARERARARSAECGKDLIILHGIPMKSRDGAGIGSVDRFTAGLPAIADANNRGMA